MATSNICIACFSFGFGIIFCLIFQWVAAIRRPVDHGVSMIDMMILDPADDRFKNNHELREFFLTDGIIKTLSSTSLNYAITDRDWNQFTDPELYLIAKGLNTCGEKVCKERHEKAIQILTLRPNDVSQAIETYNRYFKLKAMVVDKDYFQDMFDRIINRETDSENKKILWQKIAVGVRKGSYMYVTAENRLANLQKKNVSINNLATTT